MKFLVKFDLEFDLKFEISDGKNLVKFWGRTFRPARKARKISGRISGQISDQISEKISETSFQISRFFSETLFSRRAVLREFIRDKFGELLVGSQAPPSFWEVPGLPRKFRALFGDLPGSSLTVKLNSNAEVPRKFTKLPGKFPKLPRKFRDFPGGQPLSLGSLTPSPDSQELSLSSIAVEDAVENRGLYRVFASRLF